MRLAFSASFAMAQGPTPSPQEVPPGPSVSLEQLLGMGRDDLDRLYGASSPGPLPDGRVRGRVILSPGTALTRPASRITPLIWQGKVIDVGKSRATNRFFGVKLIRGELGEGPSWMDGRPATILDYSRTSLLYRNYRDEIRQVGPGLYLGAMYSRKSSPPAFMMYFVLQATPDACR